MTPNLAKCLLVAKVVIADGMITDEEREFLNSLMTEFDLTDEERERVTALDGLDQAIAFVQKLPLEERQSLLERLMDAAGADGHLSPLELATVKKVSAALGI